MWKRERERNIGEEDDRKCKICRGAEESLFHVLKECDVTKNKMSIEEFIREKKRVQN